MVQKNMKLNMTQSNNKGPNKMNYVVDNVIKHPILSSLINER